MPPLPPPNGMSCSALFQVIAAARPFALIEGHALVVADAAPVRAKDVVVLHAVALEHA